MLGEKKNFVTSQRVPLLSCNYYFQTFQNEIPMFAAMTSHVFTLQDLFLATHHLFCKKTTLKMALSLIISELFVQTLWLLIQIFVVVSPVCSF